MLKLEDLQGLTEKIRTSVGEEQSALISNDLLGVVGAFTEASNELDLKDAMIQKLEADKKELLIVNSQLFQKVGFDQKKEEKESKEDEKIDVKSFINEKGDFI